MADIIIRNGIVIAIDALRRVIPDGAVAIEGSDVGIYRGLLGASRFAG